MKRLCVVAVLSFACLCARGLFADEVVLTDGDRITGKIVEMTDGTLQVETAYAGAVSIKWDAVAQVSSDEPVKVKLATGETIEGTLRPGAAGALVAKSAAVGETQSIPLKNVTSLNAPPVPPAKWSGYVDIGSTYRTGNVEALNGRARLSMVRETKQDRMSAGAAWNYEESENVLTARNASAQLKYDYFPWERVYVYGATALETDEFKDLNLRTKLGVGMGRKFIVEPKRTLEGEAGVTYINDDYETATDEDSIALRLFGKYTHVLLDDLDFMQSLEVLPSVEDLEDVLLVSVTEFSTTLSARWSAVLTLLDEYDNTPSPGFKRNDFASILSLRYSF